MGNTWGVVYGVLFGFIIDIVIGKNIGITSIVLTITGVLGALFDKNFSKDSRITLMTMVAVTTVIYEVIKYALMYFVLKINPEVATFIRILLIETIFNVLLTIILYPLMQSTGYDVEEKFKGNKLLTRYF